MFRKEVAGRPLLLWLLCAMTAPVAQLLAGCDFWLVAALGIICTAVSCINLKTDAMYGKWICGLQIVWMTLVLGTIAGFTGESWPMGNTRTIVPLVLLALAAWSAGKGAATAARTAGILFILLCIGYGLVLAAGLAQVDWTWVVYPEREAVDAVVFVFLIPGIAACIPRKKGNAYEYTLFGILGLAILISIVTCGSLDPQSVLQSYPFFEMSRSLSVLGFAERFEALVCAMVTVGWFSFMSLLFSGIGSCCQRIFPGKGTAGLWGAAILAYAMILGKMSISGVFLSVGAAVFWGFIPAVTQLVAVRKKDGKK